MNYPSDWKVSTLGSIGTFTKGAPLSKYDISETGTPFVLYGELYTTYREVTYKIYRHTKQVVASLYYSRVGDVIIPTSGETAEEIATACCVMVSGAILAGDLNIYRADGFDGRYVSYVINHVVNRQISDIAQGSSIIHINAKELKKIEIYYPELSKQTAIADALDTLDTHIANLAELIEKKKAIRDGALEDLVSDRTRLPGFDYKWEDSHIGKILKILHGKNQRQVEATNGHYPIMGTGGIIGRATDYLCDWECVLIGRKGTINQPYYMNTPFWTIDTLYYSKPAENQCVKFQYYLFRTISWYDYTESSGRPSLTRKAIEGIEIKLPRYEEQKAIADVLTAMDDEIKALEDERNKIIQIREGAMDDLLTGRVRLSV